MATPALDRPTESARQVKAEDWQAQAARDAWGAKSPHDRAQAPADRGSSPAPEWTVAYYLGAEKPDLSKPFDRSLDTGAPDKAAKLKEMAAETKGKPVTAYVDVLREKDESYKARQAKGQTEPSGNPADYMVDHYRLRDGKVEGLGSTQSKGLTDDVKHLVRDAAGTKSAKLALVVNGDGAGNRGEKADSSNLVGNGELSDAIKQGLDGSSHKRLDLLNFDECLMGQTGALDKYKDVTKDIVASPETERVSRGRVNGQDLGKELHTLLADPSMTGRQWGDQIVAGANRGDNDRPGADPNDRLIGDSGTTTLSNIDTTKLPGVSSAVDDLGKQLKKSIADPSNKAEIDRIIKDIPRFGIDQAASDSSEYQTRDLKTFTDSLQKSLESGALKDPDGTLRASIEKVKQAEQAAVTSFHGDAIQHKDYDKQGGLSIYLPDLQFRDVDKTLDSKTKLAKAAEIIDNMAQRAQDKSMMEMDPSKEGVSVGAINGAVAMLFGHEPTAEERDSAKPLMDALDKLKADTTAADRQRDLDNAARIAHEMVDTHSPLQRKLVAKIDRAAVSRTQTQSRDLELSADPQGWKDFVMSMGWAS